jgi:5'-methylthioadenosine phosphorylase
MKAIIAGFSFDEIELFSNFSKKRIETERGEAILFVKGGWAFLPRHGPEKAIPPHRINHQANILALKEIGVKSIFSINSTGSLKIDLTPAHFVVPDDYFCLSPLTFYDDRIVHIVPELNKGLREVILKVARRVGLNPKDGGVYIQTKGPRLETKAEIRFLQKIGDLVGMTMADEATIAQELDIPYASLCSVDNFCHGIGAVSLTLEEMRKNSSAKREKLIRFLEALIEYC